MALIEIKDLSFSYPEAKRAALDSIELTVDEGEFVLVAGASGCGKSTLLRRLKPSLSAHGDAAGGVLFGGEPIEALSKRREAAEIGFVMQDPEMQIVTDKVWHELAFGLESLGEDERTMRTRVAEIANFFGIQSLFDRPVRELSGGQKQLVCLASVMVIRPRLLLLDEPTSQLDPIAAGEFFDTLKRINQELGTTIIVTEHRVESLFPLVDRFVYMKNGSIAYSGSPRGCAGLIGEDPALFAVLPTALSVYYGTGAPKELVPPLTVREGRSYLKSRLESGPSSDASTEKTPVIAAEHRSEKREKHEKPEKRKRGEKPVLSMREAWFRYERNGADILKGASLDVHAGELLAVIGGNGAGKTTAIMAASGLFKPYRGKVTLDGKPVSRYSEGELFGRRIGVLLQNPILSFTEDSVSGELEVVRRRFRLEGSRVDEIVRLMELEDILPSNPYDISGGELQRAAIAKLLLTEPSVIFLDEATKGMDAFFKEKFGVLLRTLTARGTAIVLVSHDIEFCAEYADRLAMFFGGAVIAEGSPREVLSQNSFYTTVAGRIASGILPGAITASELAEAINGAAK